MTEERKDLWPMRLNKYIAYAGITSRRNAENLVRKGQITVNGQVATVPFIEIQEDDVVLYKGKRITPTRQFVYFLLNKPKNCISTVSDDRNRRTVLDLIKESKKYRLYPVGRLDRDTTGLILLTNDGHLTQKLSHPRYEVSKVYHAALDKPVDRDALQKLQKGGKLEDGFLKPDALHYSQNGNKREIMIEIHSGKNRIVRRFFEHFGYEVLHLDRVYYAGLTKKNLPRGRYRALTSAEVRNLKYLGR